MTLYDTVGYDTVYTCPIGRLQRWCMYLVADMGPSTFKST